MMKVTSAEFIKSAFAETDWPGDRKPEIAFLGRSNVGKSSFINSLLGVRGLARTSSTPGRTQSVNFFLINGKFRFVDLPGYGYARAPRDVKANAISLCYQFTLSIRVTNPRNRTCSFTSGWNIIRSRTQLSPRNQTSCRAMNCAETSSSQNVRLRTSGSWFIRR
jgi:hypothetical protein